MSSRSEVLIRILALLQRKTLLETKNRTLKCLKWHYSTVHVTTRAIHEKSCSVNGGRPGFALFFRSHPGGFGSSRVPTPGNLPSKAKKMLIPGCQPRGGGGLGVVWIESYINFSVDTVQQNSSCMLFTLCIYNVHLLAVFIFHSPRWRFVLQTEISGKCNPPL